MISPPCSLCSGPGGDAALIRRGEIVGCYESRKHDTVRFAFSVEPSPPVEVPPDGDVCDTCIDRMVANGLIYAYATDISGPMRDLGPEALTAAFFLGCRQCDDFIAAARLLAVGSEMAAKAIAPWGVEGRKAPPTPPNLAILPLAGMFAEGDRGAHPEDPKKAGTLFALGHRAVMGAALVDSDIRAEAARWTEGVVKRREDMESFWRSLAAAFDERSDETSSPA